MNRILIAEDDGAIRELVRLTLERAGHACDAAADGEEAADLVQEHDYELAVLDIMLPKIDGWELLDYLSSLGVPVIFLTAKGKLPDRLKGLRLG
ncbi:MAG: response regulator, partial [Oscillospiraceae bacterium]|nr:response regulator [Oscillospiraceae bacterium]